MDRREAVKRLGAAGAIVVGGSAVLSSRDVAYAASGSCIPEIPGLVTVTIVEQVGRVVLTCAPPPFPSATPTYRWFGPAITSTIASPPGGVRVDGSSTSSSVALVRTASPNGSGSIKEWTPLDAYRIDLEITWSCVGSPSDVAVYRVSAVYGGATTADAPRL